MLFRYNLSEPFIGVSGLIINYFDKGFREYTIKISSIIYFNISNIIKIWRWKESHLYIFERHWKIETLFCLIIEEQLIMLIIAFCAVAEKTQHFVS